MTPTFSRIWLMKMAMVLVLAIVPESLRKAWLIRAGLETDVGVTHFTFDFGPRHQGGNGVDHDDVDGPAGDQGVRDLQPFFPSVWLRQDQWSMSTPKASA